MSCFLRCSVFLLVLFSIVSPAQAQPYLDAKWLVQPDLPLSTGPVYIADAVKSANDDMYVIGTFQNGADFNLGADTTYVQAPYANSQFLAKYDKAGRLLFVDCMTGSRDQGYNSFGLVTADAKGNVYITGVFGNEFDFDPGPAKVSFTLYTYYGSNMFVAKYDSAGHFVFAHPITAQNSKCYPSALVVDKQNNICIGGYMLGNKNDFDPGPGVAALNADTKGDGFFAKYDANGNFIFAKLLSGDAAESVTGLATDNQDNILVTGFYNSSTNDLDPGPDTVTMPYKGNSDLFLAKYDKLGNYLFAKSVGGKGRESANAVVTDGNNNIFITGSFSGMDADFDPGPGTVLRSATGTGGYSDVFTEKFDSSGNYKWVSTAGGTDDELATIALLDAGGAIYITGYLKSKDAVFGNTTGDDTLKSIGGYDIFYAKYDTVGTCLFAQDIGTKADNYVTSLFLTSDNYFTLTCSYIDSVDCNPSPQKNMLYARNTTSFFATYNTKNGDYVSAKDIDVFGYYRDESAIYDVKQDDAGNTYVIGLYAGITDFDPGTGKVILTPANEIGHDIFDYDEDQFFAKYDRNGKLVFVKTFTTTGHDPMINGLTVDDEQNIYICGVYSGLINYVPGTDTAIYGNPNGVFTNAFFAKYDATGKYLYSVNIKSTSTAFNSIALDKQKNIHLAGVLWGRARFNPADTSVVTVPYGQPDMLIVAYNNAGQFLYVKHMGQNGTINGVPDYMYLNDMKISGSGRMVVCGELMGNKTDFDPGAASHFLSCGKARNTYFMAAYTLAGDFLFATAADTSSTGSTTSNKLAFDGDNVIITGMSYAQADLDPGAGKSVTNDNVRCPFFIAYKPNGTIRFINTNAITAAGHNLVDMYGISTDTAHHIYITGDYGGKVDFDFSAGTAFLDSNGVFIAKYDSAGNYDFVQGFVSVQNHASGICVNTKNEVLLAGSAYGDIDLDSGPGSLLFQAPVYRHRAFYVAKYKDISMDRTVPLLISMAREEYFRR